MKKEIRVNDGLIYTELGGSYSTACLQKPDGMRRDWFGEFCDGQVFAQAVQMFSEEPEDWENIPADLFIDGKFIEHDADATENWSDADIDTESFKKVETATKGYLQNIVENLNNHAAADRAYNIADVISLGFAGVTTEFNRLEKLL